MKIQMNFLFSIFQLYQQLTHMHISSKKYRLAELKKENVEESAKVLAHSFLHHNKIWKNYQPTQAEVFDFMVRKTIEMVDTQNGLIERGVLSSYINYIYLDQNDVIVGVCVNYQLEHYLNTLKSTVALHHFNTLEKIGLELEKSIKKEDIVPGKCLYGMFASVTDQLIGSRVALLFFYDIAVHCKIHGFKYMYGRCSNIRSFNLFMKLGGQMTAKMKVKDQNNEFTISFVKVPIYLINELQQKILSHVNAKL